MIVDPIFFSPEGNFPQEVEYVVFAIVFEKEDLEDLGLPDDALEYNELYFEKDEYTIFKAKLKDPIYLHSFYIENEVLLKEQFWARISRDRFVVDTITSYPTIFSDFKKAFKQKTLYDLFEPLDRTDEEIRKQNEGGKHPHRLVRLKSRYGFIAEKVPFRLYAIEVDTDCFIITGGAIKIVEEMKQAPNTYLELKKIDYVFKELQEAGINNKESLLDYLYERSSQADI